MKKRLAIIAASAMLLSGCGAGQGQTDSEKNTGLNSSITLKAEDESLLSECTQVAEARLMAEYPQIECKVSYKSSDSVSIISFDRPDNWNDDILDTICRYGRLTFRKGTDTQKDADGNVVPTGEIVIENSDIDVASSTVIRTEKGQEYAVAITTSESGKTKLATATGELAETNIPLSIWLDDELISAPTVAFQITDGNAIINGDLTAEKSMEIAAAIDSGALPCGLKVIDKHIGDDKK